MHCKKYVACVILFYSVFFQNSGFAQNNTVPVELQFLTGHSYYVTSVAFSPDGSTLAFDSYDNTIRLLHAKTHELIASFSGYSPVYSVAFSQDGSMFASGNRDGTYIYKLKESVFTNPVKLFHVNNTSIAFNTKNKYLIHPGNTSDVYFKAGLDLKYFPVYTDRQIEVFTHNNRIILHSILSRVILFSSVTIEVEFLLKFPDNK